MPWFLASGVPDCILQHVPAIEAQKENGRPKRVVHSLRYRSKRREAPLATPTEEEHARATDQQRERERRPRGDDPQPCYNLGAVLLKLGRAEEAIDPLASILILRNKLYGGRATLRGSRASAAGVTDSTEQSGMATRESLAGSAARAAGRTRLAEQILRRLELYRAGEPYREVP